MTTSAANLAHADYTAQAGKDREYEVLRPCAGFDRIQAA